MKKEDMTAVVVGGIIGAGAGLGGDYLNFKYPQKDANDQPIAVTSKDYSALKDKSIWVNAGVGIVGLGMGAFSDKLKLKDEVALGASVAGVVALTKALAHWWFISQQQGTGGKWANYARTSGHQAYRQSVPHRQTFDGPIAGLFGIK